MALWESGKEIQACKDYISSFPDERPTMLVAHKAIRLTIETNNKAEEANRD